MAGKTGYNNLPAPKTGTSGKPQQRATTRALARAAALLRKRPRLTITGGAAALAVAGGAIIALQADHTQTAVDPRTRVFANYTVCLLTGPDGTGTQPAAAIWKGMQQASTATNERATNQSIIGAQTTQNAEEYINTLASLRCRVVITIGEAPAQAALNRAPAYPDIQFISIAATLPDKIPQNMSSLPATATITAGIEQTLTANFNTHNKATNPQA